MIVTVTTFGCKEYLARMGFIPGAVLEYIPVIPKRILISKIQATVAHAYRIPIAEMKSNRRDREVARPRQIAMYLARHLTPKSLPEIGRMFGNRDHTTVMHAIRQIDRLRDEDAELDEMVNRLIGEVEA